MRILLGYFFKVVSKQEYFCYLLYLKYIQMYKL